MLTDTETVGQVHTCVSDSELHPAGMGQAGEPLRGGWGEFLGRCSLLPRVLGIDFWSGPCSFVVGLETVIFS